MFNDEWVPNGEVRDDECSYGRRERKPQKRTPQNGGIMISIEVGRDLMAFYAAKGKETGVSAYQAMRNVLYAERTKAYKEAI